MKTYTNIIEADALKELVEKSVCRVVDCRFDLMHPPKGREEYVEGHIPGAVYADLDVDLAGPVTPDSGRHPLPAASAFQHLLNGWGLEKGQQIVVYDHTSGAIAARLWWLMKWVGHENVAILNGGIDAWRRSGFELTTGIPALSPVPFEVQPNPQMVVTTEELTAAVHSGGRCYLLDARDAKRFAGEIEPIDTVAGHVPGAVNLPFQNTLEKDGTWKKEGALLPIWQAATQGRPEASMVSMCGSGVTACHLLVTTQLLGLTLPKLYVGSWSEWIRDDSRPVAIGGE